LSTNKNRHSISPTNEKSKVISPTNNDVIEKSQRHSLVEKSTSNATPPVVEKSYLNSPEKLSSVTSAESSRPSTKVVTPIVESPTKNNVSPTHFVGGWKPPSPTKEIQSPVKEDRTNTVDKDSTEDNEDLTLLERVTFFGFKKYNFIE
jgi:hypothetical protein